VLKSLLTFLLRSCCVLGIMTEYVAVKFESTVMNNGSRPCPLAAELQEEAEATAVEEAKPS
jgi:hypothetical protein